MSDTYDVWGRLLSSTGSKAGTVGVKNPFRYRGYYYDTESGLYYLNSRYYDPVVGRFLNADSISVMFDYPEEELLGRNLYAYCLNDPIKMLDYNGEYAIAATALEITGKLVLKKAIFAGLSAAVPVLGALVGAIVIVKVVVKVVPKIAKAANKGKSKGKEGKKIKERAEKSLRKVL